MNCFHEAKQNFNVFVTLNILAQEEKKYEGLQYTKLNKYRASISMMDVVDICEIDENEIVSCLGEGFKQNQMYVSVNTFSLLLSNECSE